MLKRCHRLKSRKVFKHVLTGRALGKTPAFVVYAKRHKDDDSCHGTVSSVCRFGMIISKKVSKKAVVRNKIRRRLQAILRRHVLVGEAEKVAAYATVIFIVRHRAVETPFSVLEQQVCQLFSL